VAGKHDIRELWDKYRQDMLFRTGISIFLFGNKKFNDQIVKANSVISEFEIAHKSGNMVVPVGAIGYASKEILGKVKANFDNYFSSSNQDIKEAFGELNNESLCNSELVDTILRFIKLITK
jgi:hypothetical protein